MRNQLESYVNLLFAGNPEAEDIREEILRNTLDCYDDLLDQGRTPETAYSMAIAGIGNVSEILRGTNDCPDLQAPVPGEKRRRQRLLRSIAVALYILCPVPLFLLQNELGLCLLMGIVAAATGLMVFSGKGKSKPEEPLTPAQKCEKAISDIIWTLAAVTFFLISFQTFAWHITWIIFPLAGAVNGLVKAILDLRKES